MEDLIVDERTTIPAWELWFTTSRASGPGGQAVNKTSSRVTLHWHIVGTTAFDEGARARVIQRLARRIGADGVLQIDVEAGRSQLQNKELARERLAGLVRAALVVQPRRIATRPSQGAVRRRLEDKSRTSERKQERRPVDGE
jgi:ribosome-associated protein